MTLFHFLSPIKRSVWAPGICIRFVTGPYLWWGVSTLPNPQTWEPPLVGCPRTLIQYIRIYPLYWRMFLHLQPEDAPCQGHRDSPVMGSRINWLIFFITQIIFNIWRPKSRHLGRGNTLTNMTGMWLLTLRDKHSHWYRCWRTRWRETYIGIRGMKNSSLEKTA